MAPSSASSSSSSTPVVSSASPPVVPAPTIKIRNTPCQECRLTRNRCIWVEGSAACTRCRKGSVVCSGPFRVNAMKCSTCSGSKVKCEWLSENECIRCARLGKICPGSRPPVVLEYSAATAETIKRPDSSLGLVKTAPVFNLRPSSPTSKIFTTQLGQSLAYHCIWLCCANNLISFAGGDPALYMDYFLRTRQSMNLKHKTTLYEQVLTSLVIFTGATFSNHSAVVGKSSGPSFESLWKESDHNLKGPNSLPVLSPQRTLALDALSTTVADHTTSLLAAPSSSFKESLDQLGLVRLVLSKATAVDTLWQCQVCEAAIRKGLRLLKVCSASERETLLPLLRSFAFKLVVSMATEELPVTLALSKSRFERIFDPPLFLPPISPEEATIYLYGPISRPLFLQFLFQRISKSIYDHLATSFFNLVQPESKATLESVWAAVESFQVFKDGFFSMLWARPESTVAEEKTEYEWRESLSVRILLSYGAKYWTLILAARILLDPVEGDEGLMDDNFRAVVPGIAEDVALLLSLPTSPTRKLEILIQQITLLLRMPTDELARYFAELDLPDRSALLRGIRASSLMGKGQTAAHLDALMVLLHATDPTQTSAGEHQDQVPAIHVACALLDLAKPSSSNEQVSSLFVLVA